jgi:(1->4)-alpha-D-glucan 1-alpha-D-glucosylmutase
VARSPAPDVNDEYLIYQLLVALMPATEMPNEELRERLAEYLVKALREAKRHTSWIQTNEAYERAAIGFTETLLDKLAAEPFSADTEASEPDARFAVSFRAFANVAQDRADALILARTTIRMMMPGIPDTYQGSELRDLTLVDPDNRRPVDYGRRRRLLSEAAGDASAGPDSAKLRVVSQLLQLRQKRAELFADAPYVRLSTESGADVSVIAFARGNEKTIVVAALTAPVESTRTVEVRGLTPGASYRGLYTRTTYSTDTDGSVSVDFSLEHPSEVLELLP